MIGTTQRPLSYLWSNGNTLYCFKFPSANEKLSESFLSKSEILKFAKRVDLEERKGHSDSGDASADRHYRIQLLFAAPGLLDYYEQGDSTDLKSIRPSRWVGPGYGL